MSCGAGTGGDGRSWGDGGGGDTGGGMAGMRSWFSMSATVCRSLLCGRIFDGDFADWARGVVAKPVHDTIQVKIVLAWQLRALVGGFILELTDDTPA